MDKRERTIMVIGREDLFGNDYFQGFMPAGMLNFELRILENFEWLRKDDAEKNPSYKQPIAYSIIMNPSLGQVFAYQRAKIDAYYEEKRLQGKWSWGIGGHIERVDEANPIQASMLRELHEEVEIDGSVKPRVLGYINEDNDDVGKVHFGILYSIETDAAIIKPKDPEIAEGKLRSLPELEEILSTPHLEVEGWSRIAFEQLKRKFD